MDEPINDPLITRLEFEFRARELGIPFVDLTVYRPDMEALACVPRLVAEQNQALPVKLDGNVLYVAMAAPDDRQALDSIRQVTPYTVRAVQAVPAEILNEIKRLYVEEGLEGQD